MLIFLVGKFSFGQYPINQSIGSDSTLVTSKGGLKGRIVVYSYADTAAANLERIRQYAGAMIYTTGVEKLYYRNTAASAWVELGSSAGGVNIYNSDGTIDGPRNINGGAFDISWGNFGDWSSSVGAFTVSQGATSAFSMEGDTSFFSRRVSYATNLGSTFTRHTLVDKNYVDSLQNIIPTLQQVLTAGSILTTNNTINYGGNDFKLRGDSIVLLAADGTERLRLIPVDDGAPGGASQITFINADEAKMTIQSGDQYLETTTGWFIRNTVGVNSSLSVNGSSLSGGSPQVAPLVEVIQGAETLFELSNDSFSLRPPGGKIYIDSIRTLAAGDDEMMTWNPRTGVVSHQAIPSGGGSALPDTAAAIRSDFPNTYADLTTSIVDEDGFYNGFPWPIMRGDTIIVYLKHSTEHANAGTMRIYKSFNGGRTWNTTGNVTVDGVEIQCTSIQNGIFNDTIHIAYTKDADYDTLFYAKGTSGGIDFYGAGYVTYQTGWVGSPSIQSMFTLVSDTIFSPQYEIDTDSSKAFLNYYTGGVWRRGATVLTQTNAAFPEGRTSEWYAVVTEQGTMDANTKLAMLFRREDGSYYLFASTSNGFTTVTRDNTNLFYEMGNQGSAAPIMMINVQGIIYIVCGNRRINSTYAIEYVTSPATSFFTNTQSAYSKVRKLYASTAATKAAAIDFGYPLPFQYNNKPYIAFYDVSPVYHISGEGSDDDVRSISFPLLDRGYSEKYNDANQSITDSTQTLVSYPDLLLDCMGSWDWDGDANTTDTVWEAKEDGWYMVNAIATFEANGTGSYRQMYVIVVDPGVNTTATNQMISKTTIPGNSSIADFNRLECNGMAYIKTGEQVKVYVKHDATSALNLLNTSRETMATVKITLVR